MRQLRQFLLSLWSVALIVTLLLLSGFWSERAIAQEPTGQLTIHQDTDPESNNVEFDYDFDPGSDFDLEDDQSITKTLAPGQYEIQQIAPAGWVLVSVTCDLDVLYSVNLVTSTLVIDIDADDDDIDCTFDNAEVPAPTPTPVPTATPRPPEPQVVFQPIFIPAPAPPQPVIVERVVERVAPAAPVVGAKPATSVVRPPSTGDGALR